MQLIYHHVNDYSYTETVTHGEVCEASAHMAVQMERREKLKPLIVAV